MNFTTALRVAGLRPRDVVADGRWRRCATESHPTKRNGAYKLDFDGRRGWFCDWADGAGVQVWADDEPLLMRRLTPTEMAQERERQERARAKERHRRAQGVRNARTLWAAGQPYRGHPYIEAKQLSARGCTQLRTWQGAVWHNDEQINDLWLLVPMFIGGQLVGVQRIGTSGLKLQAAGSQQRCASFVIEPTVRAAVTVLCEGFATGLAIYQCVRAARVIVTFFAGNLVPVAQEIRPHGSVVVAADNDHGTAVRIGRNPGLDAARQAADLIGCGVAAPQDILGTDWADALREWGQPGARRIERLILAEAKYVMRPVT